jgi:hypothetical protein
MIELAPKLLAAADELAISGGGVSLSRHKPVPSSVHPVLSSGD